MLVNVTGGPDMTLLEVDEACNAISSEVDPEANTIFGAAFDDSLSGKIRVSVVATGMDGAAMSAIEPKPARITSPGPRPLIAPTSTSTPEPEPAIAEAAIEQPELISEAAYEEAPVAEEPQPVATLIDRAVEELQAEPETAATDTEADAEEPDLLHIPSRRQPPQKSGWLSLFGARRYEGPAEEEPVPQFRNKNAAVEARTTASAQPVEDAETDDLEIPSFLRRLAN